MGNSFFDIFRQREAVPYTPIAPVSSVPDTSPTQPNTQAPGTLQPVSNWSHPFKDKRDPLMQLTHLADANAGYYPLGRNGLWHGGVHFDSGTAGTMEQQSSVHCLADGEVVAYRVDNHSPTTAYFINRITVQKIFSRNFVLVRHRLQPPKIEGSADVPPSLTFYSLYMHLQDWADYQNDPAIARPDFWPEGATYRVKPTVNDALPGQPEQKGLNVRNKAHRGQVLALLPRGTEVTVSGEGDYRKLESTNGPDVLKSADGSLLGYVSFDHLVPINEGEYEIKGDSSLNVRAEANASSAIIAKLPAGTEVTISGDGDFRKLERVNQYVHFKSLQGALKPQSIDSIVVLEHPIAINAGDLIGHIGKYQDLEAESPEEKLHLEVFTADKVDTFIKESRIWADRLPAAGKTWLKLAKGTAVVAPQSYFNATRPPSLSSANTPSNADLLIPKSLLEGLPADRKITVAATVDHKAYNWYYLDTLLYDANNVLLEGWVCEKVGVTPWVNPWSWEGYDTLLNHDSPRQALASFRRAVGYFSEAEVERYNNLADMSDKGHMKERLYDIIDRDRNGKMTAEEVQAAIRIPAYAQSLSQLIILYESEWYYTPQKWDGLDELLGHTGSTPELNWLAEKERIKQITWWSDVAPKVDLPTHAYLFHLHPLGLVGNFHTHRHQNSDLIVRRGQVTFDAEGNDIQSSPYFSRQLHWPGGASGVTLGRGYDIRHRTQDAVRADLIAAGVDDASAENFSRGAGLSGETARNFVRENRDKFGVISQKSQRILFEEVVYPRYEEAAKNQYNSSATQVTPTWEQLDSRIKDIAVDLTYQQGSIWSRQLPYIFENNKESLASYIQSTPELAQYEQGRHRARYLRMDN